MSNEIINFEDKKVRKIEYNGEWFFSVVDVVAVLTNNNHQEARNYWKVLKNRLKNEDSYETVTKCNRLKLKAEDGKMRATDCANIETIFRLIQSIPSPKAEPIKQWLAKVGYERIEEIENPEIAQERMMEIYRQKGYEEGWIKQRIQSIITRKELTDEWKLRGAVEKDYSFFTAIMSQSTFGITPKEHKQIKKLKRENLRDHMSNIEIALVNLGEATAKELHKSNNTKGRNKLKKDVLEAGIIAGNTRKAIEKKTKKSVIDKKNYLLTKENK